MTTLILNTQSQGTIAKTSSTPNVLIIGGNRGIGLSLVKLYLESGYNVFTTYNNTASSKKLFGIINSKLEIKQINLLDSDVLNKIDKFVKTKPIDVIIYNAGLFGYKSNQSPILNTQDWLDSFQINSIIPIQIAFALKNNLIHGNEKKFVAISSRRASNNVNIKDSYVGRYSYRSSKAALNSSLVALALDLQKDNITVLMLHPGRVATKMTNFNGIDPSISAKKIKNTVDKCSMEQTGKFIDVITEDTIMW